ncbi:hypothetical protein SGLAM104S_06543 [Streptomyces glaucescens]
MLVLNVPMLERNEEGVPDAEVRALLRQGAAGRFDHHFRALAERLVALRVPDTVLVLGWEMNGTTYTHRCGPDPESWKKYWNRIVTTMRSVPGQAFRFDFTPSRGKDAVAWTECYPGDDVVDIVGMDSYDQPAGMSFDEQVSEPYGLRRHVEFAAQHGKAISYPEWGLFRNGDNAEYMRRMLAWMDEHKPLYNTLTDYCPHGVWQCDENPEAAEVYRSVLSGRTGEGRPPVSPSASPPVESPASPPATEPAPQPSADCTPLDLGDWVEHWLGELRAPTGGRGPTDPARRRRRQARSGPAATVHAPAAGPVPGPGPAVRPGTVPPPAAGRCAAGCAPTSPVTAGDAEDGSAGSVARANCSSSTWVALAVSPACRVRARATALAMSAARSGRAEVAVTATIGTSGEVAVRTLDRSVATGTPAHTWASPSTASWVAARP